MGRWEPNARGRLEAAALELFNERGYDQTTAAEIAERAGLTERTFFRHFADKREVLFGGAAALQELIVSRIADAPDGLSPLGAVASGLEGAAEMLQGNRRFAVARNTVIMATPELQERELIKLATLASAAADTLRGRGVPDPAASLTAEAGISVFKVAFERWVRRDNRKDFALVIRESLDELRKVARP